MKLRHPSLLKAAAAMGAWALRGWIGTLRYRYCPLGPALDPRHVRRRHIYAFWHENMLLPAYHYGRLNAHVLISRHADGELMAGLLRHLGFRAVRGSTSRDSVRAVREILGLEGETHLGITPDGPRGPRRQVQMGLIYLSSRLGLPIVPAGFGCERPWRLKSWDRFVLPRPFTRARCVTCDPVLVPPDAGRDLLEAYRLHVEERLLDVSAQAERWAEAGVAPQRRDVQPPAGCRPLAA